MAPLALGTIGDPILIPDSPPRASYNEASHSPRRDGPATHQAPSPARSQEVARDRCQQWLDDLSSSDSVRAEAGDLAPSRAPTFNNGLAPADAPRALVLRGITGDSMVDEHGVPVRQILTQHRAPRGSNPYMNEKPERRLPVQTLPYNVKHSILQAMQKIMEEALFEWAKEWAPIMLKMAGWETAEAGELNWWWRTISSYSKRVDSVDGARYNARHISANAFSRSVGVNMQKLQHLLDRLSHVRHAAVHRDPSITISALKKMLADAHCLTAGLRDRSRTDKLYGIQLALAANDIKWIDAMIATPVPNFRTQPPPSADENTQSGSLKRKRSESVPLEKASRKRAEEIEFSAKPTRVIDLTGDEVVVLFRSVRSPPH